MGVQRESEVSLGLGVQGGHEGPPWSRVRGMKSPRSGPRAESPGRGMQRGRNAPCQDERGRRLSGCAVLHAHILRAVLTVTLVNLRRVTAAEFAGGTITQTARKFPHK